MSVYTDSKACRIPHPCTYLPTYKNQDNFSTGEPKDLPVQYWVFLFHDFYLLFVATEIRNKNIEMYRIVLNCGFVSRNRHSSLLTSKKNTIFSLILLPRISRLITLPDLTACTIDEEIQKATSSGSLSKPEVEWQSDNNILNCSKKAALKGCTLRMKCTPEHVLAPVVELAGCQPHALLPLCLHFLPLMPLLSWCRI